MELLVSLTLLVQNVMLANTDVMIPSHTDPYMIPSASAKTSKSKTNGVALLFLLLVGTIGTEYMASRGLRNPNFPVPRIYTSMTSIDFLVPLSGHCPFQNYWMCAWPVWHDLFRVSIDCQLGPIRVLKKQCLWQPTADQKYVRRKVQ